LTYACAGHNPPRLKRCGEEQVLSLDEIGGPPLGLLDELTYDQTTMPLRPGDVVAFYTDGITEAMDVHNSQFGVNRLDAVLGRCDLDAPGIVRAVIEAVDRFTGNRPPDDDRTLLVAKVR
jgi:sigma-B regulation protein RsbU (phosphoserine phosphatase)